MNRLTLRMEDDLTIEAYPHANGRIHISFGGPDYYAYVSGLLTKAEAIALGKALVEMGEDK